MDNSITLTSASAVRLVHSPSAVLVAIFLLGSYALPQSDFEKLGMSANELARRVVSNELRFQNEDHARWMYRLEKEDSERKQVEEILETNIGSLSRLLSISGHSLDDKQQQKENLRLQRLVSHPAEQKKSQVASNKKAEQGERLFKMLPDLFVFDYVGRQGDLVVLSFRPNPNFQPRSVEALVFHKMQGKMTVDIKQERLAAINGHLMEDVKFGAGLLGHLDEGGTFDVRQAEVAPGQWEMTALGVDIKGKALLFKTVGAHETENHSDFHRMRDNLTLAQAVRILNTPIVEADNASHSSSGASQELGAERSSASQTASLESRR